MVPVQTKLMIATALTGMALLYTFHETKNLAQVKHQLVNRQQLYQHRSIMHCTPDWNQLNSDSLANGITILQGWGNYQWKIASRSDSASLYFQQGINMYYAFHIIEAMASFKKAETFDSTNAMIYWAQALAYGPNINDYGYAATPDALAAAQKAVALSRDCSPKEKALIKSMSVRYTADSTVSRTFLNQLYVDEMQKGYLRFPGDADMGALYADALMLQHPWNLWDHAGNAKPWTPRLLRVLEKTLKEAPQHPGANHYYIHAVEASAAPQKALPSANLLGAMMPAVSHMVHMPSHIYIRTGMYTQGMKVNEDAVKGYQQYLSLYPDVINNAPLYLIHNLHMQADCAMMGGSYAYAAKTSEEARSSFDSSYLSLPSPLGGFIQYVYMTPAINNVRFGKWDSILNSTEISANYSYANVLWHWARGMAMARKKDIAGAKKELNIVHEKKNLPDMLVVMEPFNAPIDAARVAEKLLEGVIAEQENDLPIAIKAFEEAVKNEAAMIYNEPKDWILPARPYLGAALLKAGQFSKAESVFKEDLKENPNNHWSMKGLYESLQKQQKNVAAATAKKQLEKIIGNGEMKYLPIVF